MSYVSYSPWSGDIPVIYFGPSPNTTIVFSGKSWMLYHQFRVCKSDLKKYGDEFEEHLPDWAFLITNGKDQVSLMPNIGKAFLEYHTSASDTQVSIEINFEDAERMSKDLWDYASVGLAPKTRQNVRIKPIGHALTYIATRSTFKVPKN